MPGSVAVLFFLALLVAGRFLRPLARRLQIPDSVLLVPLGFLASELATRGLGVDLGIRWDNLGTLITYVLVPSLVFEAAQRLDVGELRRESLAVVLLAGPLLILAAGVTAALAFWAMGSPGGFPWFAALLAGAILGSTEMTGMFRLLQRAGAPPRVTWILEGESIFNDTAALVLFTFVLALATMDPARITVAGAGWLFVQLAVGGMLAGLACGLSLRWLLRRMPGPETFALLSLVAAYGVFLLAQDVLHVSGAMAVLVAGYLLCADGRDDPAREGFAVALWQFAGRSAGALVYLLAGVSITVEMFTDQWLAMLIGALAVLVARFTVVFVALGPACRLAGRPLGMREMTLVSWSGVRGSVTLALALSLPLALDYWYPLQSLVYGAVLFSLFVQATTVSRIARRLSCARADGVSPDTP